MDYETDDALTERASIWKRLLLMLLCGIFYSVAEMVLLAVVVVQFFFVLITDQRNRRLMLFGQSLATYIYQIIQYLNFNTDSLAYPFNQWPHGTPEENAMANNDLQDTRRPVATKLDSSALGGPGNEKSADDDKQA